MVDAHDSKSCGVIHGSSILPPGTNMFTSFVLKQLIKSKLKDVPEAQREMLLSMVEKNPDLFVQIAKEAQEKQNSGMDQMAAMQEVIKNHHDEIRKLIGQ